MLSQVDKLYSLETLRGGDGFAAAQSFMNLVEASLQLYAVSLWRSSPNAQYGDVVGVLTQLMTCECCAIAYKDYKTVML